MKFFAFTKLGLIRICAISLMLAVYLSTIIINFASDELTAGCLFSTVFFTVCSVVFILFAKLKNHPPLFLAAKGWLIASFVMSVIAVTVSIAQIELEGFVGGILGWGAMLFLSPFYGFGYIFGNGAVVGIAAAVNCAAIYFLPKFIEKLIFRINVAKDYR